MKRIKNSLKERKEKYGVISRSSKVKKKKEWEEQYKFEKKLEDIDNRKKNTCPSCGSPAGNAKFCPNCGSPIGVPTQQKKFCMNCGSSLGNTKFCTNCGAPTQ